MYVCMCMFQVYVWVRCVSVSACMFWKIPTQILVSICWCWQFLLVVLGSTSRFEKFCVCICSCSYYQKTIPALVIDGTFNNSCVHTYVHTYLQCTLTACVCIWTYTLYLQHIWLLCTHCFAQSSLNVYLQRAFFSSLMMSVLPISTTYIHISVLTYLFIREPILWSSLSTATILRYVQRQDSRREPNKSHLSGRSASDGSSPQNWAEEGCECVSADYQKLARGRSYEASTV